MAFNTNYAYHNAGSLGILNDVSDVDLAWLAAMIEAEGSITAQVTFRKNGNMSIVPLICFTNKDELVIDEVCCILDKLGVAYKTHDRLCKGSDSSFVMHNIRIDRFNQVKSLLNILVPFIRGCKKTNADEILWFINNREANLFTRDKLGRVVRNKYTEEQVKRIAAIRTHHCGHPLERMLQAHNIA